MPKTKKKFDWEVYDDNGEFIDILTMSRTEAKEYQLNFPSYRLQEIEYTNEGEHLSCDVGAERRRYLHKVRVPIRKWRISDVYQTSELEDISYSKR